MHVLFLSGPGVLKPHLSDPLAQTGDLSDPLQILAVRVRVQLKIRLQHLQLLLGERGSHPLRLVLVVAVAVTTICIKGQIQSVNNPPILHPSRSLKTPEKFTIRRCGASIQSFEVVGLAEHALLMQSKLFAGGELPMAGSAREAGQMVNVLAGFSHPIAGRDAAKTDGAFGPKTSASNCPIRVRAKVADRHEEEEIDSSALLAINVVRFYFG